MNKHDKSITLSQYIHDLADAGYQYDYSQYSDELEKWAIRIDENARAAMLYLNKYPLDLYNEYNRMAAMDFYGANDPNHPFKCAGRPWVYLHEQQITTSLTILFNQCDDATKLSILRALMPDKKWSDNLTKITAESEVKTDKGRIDILIHTYANNQPIAIVIEAKFGHNIKGNPLKDYIKYAEDRFPNAKKIDCIILATKTGKVKKDLSKRDRKNWKFIEWADFMRRMEKEIISLRNKGEYFHPQDQGFIQLRRLIWEKI